MTVVQSSSSSSSKVTVPQGYKSLLSLRETEVAIKKLKDKFESTLAQKLNLTRVSAPLFVRPETGLNDNLNGIEGPVSFQAKDVHHDARIEIVHSLAKWKRMALFRYGFSSGEGLYTDMNAIRKDEELSNVHSIYVDQWDWEKVIAKEHRTTETLMQTVQSIYEAFRQTEKYIVSEYPALSEPFQLPENIHFLTSQELENKYPSLTPKEREHAIAKEHGAVFIMQIGHVLNSGEKHDGRAPDYDDWELNGDILFWYPPLDRSVELSSMGIRVDRDALEKQLEISNAQDRRELEYHQLLLQDKLPFTIGGGLGQSRICMYFLRKVHIGEVQCSVWDAETLRICEENDVPLL